MPALVKSKPLPAIEQNKNGTPKSRDFIDSTSQDVVDSKSQKKDLDKDKSSQKSEDKELVEKTSVKVMSGDSKSRNEEEREKEDEVEKDVFKPRKSSFIDDQADRQDRGLRDSNTRKASFSGISSVSAPNAGEKNAPRKNSITGSAYAPMGFRSTLGSSDGEFKPRTSSVSSTASNGSDGIPSFSRQISSSNNDPSAVSRKETSKSSILETVVNFQAWLHFYNLSLNIAIFVV